MKRKINLWTSVLALVTCLVTFCATLAVSYQTAFHRMETETSRQAALVAAGLEEIKRSVLALVTCLVTFCATLAVSYQTAFHRMETETSRQAALVAAGLEEIKSLSQEMRMEYLVAVGKSDRSRVTLIDPDGTVIFDSNTDPDQMENHLERPEVQEAMQGGQGAAARTSSTLGHQTYYTAIQLSTGEILRLSNTTDIVMDDLQRAIPPLLLIILLVCGLSMWLAHQLTVRLVAPINTLNLEKPLENNIYEEFSPLLSKIHAQNLQIQQQIEILRRRQVEFEAITRFSSRLRFCAAVRWSLKQLQVICRKV